MALGTVQAGYGASLCACPVYFRAESELSYADLLAELTTELELACKEGDEEPVTDEEAGEDDQQTEAHSNRKKEWEELLEQSVLLEAMLRQMLEHGLGQRNESQQENLKKRQEGEPDNEFDLSGVPAEEEGRHKGNDEYAQPHGNSEFLQSRTGGGSEYFSSTNGGRTKRRNPRLICLTCELECDQKKHWRIAE